MSACNNCRLGTSKLRARRRLSLGRDTLTPTGASAASTPHRPIGDLRLSAACRRSFVSPDTPMSARGMSAMSYSKREQRRRPSRRPCSRGTASDGRRLQPWAQRGNDRAPIGRRHGWRAVRLLEPGRRLCVATQSGQKRSTNNAQLQTKLMLAVALRARFPKSVMTDGEFSVRLEDGSREYRHVSPVQSSWGDSDDPYCWCGVGRARPRGDWCVQCYADISRLLAVWGRLNSNGVSV